MGGISTSSFLCITPLVALMSACVTCDCLLRITPLVPAMKKKSNLENLKNSLFFIHANQRSTDSYILFNSYC